MVYYMNPSSNNILNKTVNWCNSFSSKPTPEAGDGLPDEVTALLFAQLSPLDWMKSCELVCRKWKRITNQARLWEGPAHQFKVSFNFQPDQPITLEIKKQICTYVKVRSLSILAINKLKDKWKEAAGAIESVDDFLCF